MIDGSYFNQIFLLMVIIGFLAQMCDGVLGMGFGLISSTVLLIMGVPAPVAAAAVNGAKMFTGSAQSYFHWRAHNIDREMAMRLAFFGVIGGIVGALLLVKLPLHWLKPVISGYLVLVGIYILILSRGRIQAGRRPGIKSIATVGFAGGALEATAGVYGPLVTSNLVALGSDPRKVVGSGTFSEAVVSIAVFMILVHHIGLEDATRPLLGLLLGALIASPVAARITSRIPRKWLLIGVGMLLIISSAVRLLSLK
jgi:uncharacterized protein